MNSLKIFISRKESFIGSALKIRKESPIETEILYIEDFIDDKKMLKINDKDIIYFLSNVKSIPKVIKKLSKVNCFIFNKEFLEKDYSKDEVQEILYENGIKIPEIISFKNIKKDSFPLFCKEKNIQELHFRHIMNSH